MILINGELVNKLRENKGWSQEVFTDSIIEMLSKDKTIRVKQSGQIVSKDDISLEEIKNICSHGRKYQSRQPWILVALAKTLGVDPDLIRDDKKSNHFTEYPGQTDGPPDLIIGREDDIQAIKKCLGISSVRKKRKQRNLVAIHGWPGVGKTCLTRQLIYENDITAYFDQIFMTSLGSEADNTTLLLKLISWGKAMGIEDIEKQGDIENIRQLLNKKMANAYALFVVDDVFDVAQAELFKIGGSNCAVLITTRYKKVAHNFASHENVRHLDILSKESALDLLNINAGPAINDQEEKAKILVEMIERLPLALIIAGRLINEESQLGLDVSSLIIGLEDGVKILEADAPADRMDMESGIIPSVQALFRKSTDLLSSEMREKFKDLAPFPVKPATFDVEDLQKMWEVDDPLPIVKLLVNRGLLEPVEGERFWLHALLKAHAKALCDEEL